ncbi:hypothetical protein [Pararhizobium sp. PWRC1-1]|uniref:hypothetical protein n=1 Tax=Pararhizobium sp. PWRC1-1 TaxID=2804566 RepID=UPI003CE7F755
MIKTRLALLLIAYSFSGDAVAAGCPSAGDTQKGFVLQTPGARSEFRHAEGGIVKTVNHFDDSIQETVFSFAGLFDLARFGKEDQQFVMHPTSDLNRVLPLKKGVTKVTFARFEPNNLPSAPWSLELSVDGEETFNLGACEYKVLRIKQITKQGEEKIDVYSFLYSSELKAVLAKIYGEGTADEYTVRYDNIRSLAQ